MKFRLSTIRHSRIVSSLTLALILAFGAYYYFYVDRQREYVTARNFRQLKTVAARIQSNIQIVANLFTKIAEDKRTAERPQYLDYLKQANIQSFARMDHQAVEKSEKLVFKVGNNSIAIESEGMRMLRKEIDVANLTDPSTVFGVFDDIIIVNQAGGIVYQRPEVLVNLRLLDSLVTPDGKTLSFRSITRSTGLQKVLIAGTSFDMFLYPLHIAPGGVEPQDWVLVALTASERVWKESLQISPTTIILFSGLVFLIAICWPLFKLRFMGSRDELHRADVLFAMLSVFLAASIISFLVIDIFVIYYSLKKDLDQQLDSFAARIEQNLGQELDSAYSQLQQFVEIANPENIAFPNRVGKILHNRTSEYYPQSYPYLDVMFLIDSSGRQVAKWSTQSEPTPMISVKERAYFTNLKEGRTYQRTTAWGESMEFWLEPHYSFTTGLFATVLSVPLRELDTDPAKKVAALQFGPLSLRLPITIRGYGFCVIDESGRVLYHSDAEKNLYENLFEETDQDKALQSVVFGRASTPVTVRYWGENYRMLARPLSDLPWTILVFRDNSVFSTLHLEVVTVTVVLFSFYGLLLILLFVFACMRVGWHVEWLWPASGYRVTYLRLMLYYLSIGAVLMVFRSAGVDRDFLLLSSFFLPCVSAGLSFGMLERRLSLKLHRMVHSKTLMTTFWVLLTALVVYELMLPSLATQIIILLAVSCGILFMVMSSPVTSILKSHLWAVLGVFTGIYLLLTLIVFGGTFTLSGIAGWVLVSVGIFIGVRFLRGKPMPDFRLTYPLAATAFLVMTAVQPTLNFFQLATDSQLELMVKQNQLQLAKDLEQRADRISQEFRSIVYTPADDILQVRMDDSLDVYTSFFYNTHRFHSAATPVESLTERRELQHDILRWLMPTYDDHALQTRGLIADQSADGLWNWQRSNDGTIVMDKLGFISHKGERSFSSVRIFLPTYLYLLHRLSPVMWFLLTICIVGVVVGIFFILRSTVRRVFLVDAYVSPVSSAVTIIPRTLAQNVLMLGPPPSGEEKLLKVRNIHSIDLVEVATSDSWADAYPYGSVPANKVVAIHHFEHAIDDARQNHQKLKFLEHLVYTMHRNIVLLSSVDPLSWMVLNGKQSDNGQQPQRMGEEKNRWDILLSGFARIQFREPAGHTDFREHMESEVEKMTGVTRFDEPAASLIECVHNECWDDASLQTFAMEIIAGLHSSSRHDRLCDQFLMQLQESARTYYHSLWVACSQDERRVLVYLARNGYVGVPNLRTVEQLLRRKLLRHTPALRLMNRTFRLFALEVARPADTATELEVRSVWSIARVPILVLLIGLVVFLFATQNQFLDSAMALVTLTAGLLPALFKIVGSVQGRQGDSSKD
ncbi:MAG TPA: cache domain-containing protein [Bacteroidota bacterium]